MKSVQGKLFSTSWPHMFILVMQEIMKNELLLPFPNRQSLNVILLKWSIR